MPPTGTSISAATNAILGRVTAAAAWLRTALRPSTASAFAAPAKAARTAAGGPIGSDEHWRRASSIVESASGQLTAMHRHQKAAAGHLDSADYALQQLKDELAHVMPVPPRAPAGTLHQLKAAPAAPAPRHADRSGKAAAA